MIVIRKGLVYEVKNLIDKDNLGQIIKFINKEEKDFQDGTTNEEILDVIIDRLKYLNDKQPSQENFMAIVNASQARMWLEERTRNKNNRVKSRITGII